MTTGTPNPSESAARMMEKIPKNPSGKLLKRELRQRFVGGETLDKAIQKNFGT